MLGGPKQIRGIQRLRGRIGIYRKGPGGDECPLRGSGGGELVGVWAEGGVGGEARAEVAKKGEGGAAGQDGE